MRQTGNMTWIVSDILVATGGNLVCGTPGQTAASVSTDSRRVSPADLFIGLKGETHDGFDFVDDVVARGVSVLIVNEDRTETLLWKRLSRKGVACITVPDTVRALGDLARFHRERSGVSTVAITGSNGKTTTRKMTTAVVARRFSTLATTGNFNNEIGLPLTLLRLSHAHQWAVVELGMNHFGEIRRLSAICKPDIGVITNVGPAHLEGVGSIEGVMQAKGELLENLSKSGTAILNADDERVILLKKQAVSKTLLFGRSPAAEVRAEAIREKEHRISFLLKTPVGDTPVTLNSPGQFMVSNALAAAATGYCLGIGIEEIKGALESFRPISGRMNVLTTGSGNHIIDDTYNANPDSMKVAISTLKQLSKGERRLIVLGDMFELGEAAARLHHEIGAFAADSGADRLYAAGSFAETVAEGAASRGMDRNRIQTGTRASISADLIKRLAPGDWVLVKGSRAMAMEVVVKRLMHSV